MSTCSKVFQRTSPGKLLLFTWKIKVSAVAQIVIMIKLIVDKTKWTGLFPRLCGFILWINESFIWFWAPKVSGTFRHCHGGWADTTTTFRYMYGNKRPQSWIINNILVVAGGLWGVPIPQLIIYKKNWQILKYRTENRWNTDNKFRITNTYLNLIHVLCLLISSTYM